MTSFGLEYLLKKAKTNGDKVKRYCCNCGKLLTWKVLHDGSRKRFCQNCKQVFFESSYPAVIVAVTNAKKIIITDKGLIAGHIEKGETAEKAALREIREEVGIEVTDLQFVRTYASRKRNLLMIGYKAKAENQCIKKSDELRKAVWCRLDKPLPLRSQSIAFRLTKEVFPKARTSRMAKAMFIKQE